MHGRDGLALVLALCFAWQQLQIRELAGRMRVLESFTPSPPGQPEPQFHKVLDPRGARPLAAQPPAKRRLAAADDAPRATVRIDVDNTDGISELVFGHDESAQRVALEHDANSFRLARNASVLLEADAAGDTHFGSASQTRLHGERLSFESRRTVQVVELDGQTPSWSPDSMQIYVGDTVTWTWSSVQNVAQTDSSYQTLPTAGSDFYSGAPVLGGAFSLRFDSPGTFYYKSQNTASMLGTVEVRQFTWERGGMVLDGNLTLNGQTTSWGPEAKEVKMFLGDACPYGWEEVGAARPRAARGG